MSYSPNFLSGIITKKHIRIASSITILLFIAILFLQFFVFNNASAASVVWDGDTDANWSNGANWVGGVAPGSSDIAVFNGTYNIASTIDAGFAGSVAGIQIDSGYTQTITQARTLTIGTSNFVQADGVFTGATQTITMNGAVSLSGGTFTATSGTLTLKGDVTIGASATFAHNNGTASFTNAVDITVDVDTTETFYNITINTGGSTTDVIITAGDTLVASNTLTLTNGQFMTGTIEVPATFSLGTGWDGGDGIAHFTGATVRSYTYGNTYTRLPGIWMDAVNTSITVTRLATTTTFTFEGSIHVTQGTVDLSDVLTSAHIMYDFTVDGGIFAAPSGILYYNGYSTGSTWNVTSGAFLHSDGRVVFQSDGTITMTGFTTFYDLEARMFETADLLILPAGATQTVVNRGVFGQRQVVSNTATTRLTIQSSSTGVPASLDLQNQEIFYSAQLQDITNIGASARCYARCDDLGGNTGFDFSGSVGFEIIDPYGDVSEDGDTVTFLVALANRPQNDVVIPLTSSDTGEATVSPTSLTFTSGNWSTKQTVTVTGVNDADDDGAVSVTIALGTTTSAYSAYNGLDPRDVTVTNRDNDTAADAIDFEHASYFDYEDVSASTGTDITYLAYNWYGQGLLYDFNGGAVVDITNSKIKAGCLIDVDGVVYNISRVVDNVAFGYNVILAEGTYKNSAMDYTLSGGAGLVGAIYCTEHENSTAKLHDSFILTDSTYSFDGAEAIYDSTNNAFWSANSSPTLVYKFNLGSGVTETFIPGTQASHVAYDSLRDVLWVTNLSADTITAFNAADGTYLNGTLGASTFAVGDGPKNIIYESVNDALWIGYSGSAATGVSKINPTTGAVIGTYATGGVGPSHVTYQLVYDPIRDYIWVIDSTMDLLVAFNAATGAYANGTYNNSSFVIPFDQYNWELVYDSVNDKLWMLDQVGSTQDDDSDFAIKFDPATGLVDGVYKVASGVNDITIDTTTNRIWMMNYNKASVTVLDTVTGRYLAEYDSAWSGNMVFDGAGDLWVNDADSNENLTRTEYAGVADVQYYTMTTNDTGQLDTSLDGGIDAVAVTETLNSQNIYYSVSFDDRSSFSVWNSAWRVIASNKNADHGGTEGNWYYRDNASVWAAAVPNTAQAAISTAVAAGSNNQMDSTALTALANTDWAATGGYIAGTLDVASTFYTTDTGTSPSVDNIAFTFGAAPTSSSSSPSVDVTNIAISTNACISNDVALITLHATDADSVLLSEDANFLGAVWTPFIDDGSVAELGLNGKHVGLMAYPFTVSAGDGAKTVYIRFRSRTGDMTVVQTLAFTRDDANACDGQDDTVVDGEDLVIPVVPEVPPTESITMVEGCEGVMHAALTQTEKDTYRTGVSPKSGVYWSTDQVKPGDYIRSKTFDTVYCVTQDLKRRPYMDETTYFTHIRSFDSVKWVYDNALADFSLEHPMLPKESVTLLKFESSDKVYHFEIDNQNPSKGILYWITTEELARVMFGENWSDFVIDLNPTLFSQFSEAAPLLQPIDVSGDELRKRELLNERNSTIASVRAAIVRLLRKK